jgi:hypothetical protein
VVELGPSPVTLPEEQEMSVRHCHLLRKTLLAGLETFVKLFALLCVEATYSVSICL